MSAFDVYGVFDEDEDLEMPVNCTRTGRRELRRCKIARKLKPSPQQIEARRAKAKIKAISKEKQKRFVRTERVLRELAMFAEPTRHDASAITNYIATQKQSEVSGETFDDLYLRLASAEESLNDPTPAGIQRAKVAVTYACCSEWLTRMESSDGKEWRCFIPALMPNTYAELAAA